MSGYILMLIYPVGFLLTLTFFKYFGKRIGFDYDRNANDIDWYDDWENNEEAYIGFSTMWFMVMPVLLIVGIFKILVKFSTWYLKL